MIGRLVRVARRAMALRTLALLAATAGAVAGTMAAAVFAAPLAAQEAGIELGAKGPDASLEALDSTTVKLSTVIAGKPAVIYFWATWCGICRELEPTIDAAFKKHGGQVTFAAVAVSANQSAERVRRYTAQHYVGWKHFYDRRGDGVTAYDVPTTSYVVVLDKAGTVVYTGTGGKQDIESAIQKALK